MSDVHPMNAMKGQSESEDRQSYPSWKALGWFSAFRLLLAVGLILAYFPYPGSTSRAAASLTFSVLIPYAALVLLGSLFVYLRRPGKEHQVQVAVFVDILAFTLLLHQGGGVASNLGLLLAIAVAAGSLLMEGRLSLLFAAFATLGVITQQLYAQLYLGADANGITQAGLLGITYFTVALLGHVLYRRIQETEQIAARRQVDIADLSKLNELVIQRMGTGVLVVDMDHRVRLMNQATVQLLELVEPAPGQLLGDIAPVLAQWLAASMDGRWGEDETVSIGDRQIKPSFQLLGTDESTGVILFLRDNRALVREAQQIKLASLGQLTASIAHNIRNPLSAVSHAGQLLAESPTVSGEDLRLLDIIRRNAGRIDEIVESVLQLSRRDRVERRRIDLSTWVLELCNDYRETHGLSPDHLHLRLPAEDLWVNLDPRHLHQIFSNLCDNARQHAGTVAEPALIEVRGFRDAARGTVVAEVIDEGPGIRPDIAREIFTPFFTTSASGTGLGLYIAKVLSETNGVDLEYIAREKRGSCFRLTFPG